MKALLPLVALVLSCQARSLGEESSSLSNEEDNDIRNERDIQGDGEGYRARKSATVMKRSDMRVSSEAGSVLTTAKTELTTSTKPEITSENNANVPKEGGLWDSVKKAASVMYNSVKEGFANLANQFSSWLKGGPNNATATTSTTVHVIKRKNVDDEDEQEQGFDDEHETEGRDAYRKFKREQSQTKKVAEESGRESETGIKSTTEHGFEPNFYVW